MDPKKAAKQKREARKTVVSELYLQGYSYSQIAQAAKKRLGLAKTPSKSMIHDDVQQLLKDWREARITNVGGAVQLELERTDLACRELWGEWEKSKEEERGGLGDPRYIAEIRQQLTERRKLLGLYAPEKKEITGDLNFGSFLISTGQVTEGEGGEGDEWKEDEI